MTSISRRDVVLGAGGFALGGILAVMAGLGYREYRRGKNGYGKPRSLAKVRPDADDGWLLTTDDRLEFAAGDRLVESDVLEIRDAVDLPGGDIREFRASELQDCVSACESDKGCKAFTFARSSHPTPAKRRMCWLKDDTTGPPVTDTAAYVSGRRNW